MRRTFLLLLITSSFNSCSCENTDVMEWFFDGLGTAIFIFIFGLITGGTAGYRIGIKKKVSIKQKQNAGDNANQIQIGGDNGK